MKATSNVEKLARRFEKRLRYFESRPNHHKTVIVICLATIIALFIWNIKSVFWMSVVIGIIYIIGLKVWRGKVIYIKKDY